MTATGSIGLSNTHVRPWYDATTVAWERLRDAGIAAPIAPAGVHWVIVGAASIAFVHAPEVRLLAGDEPTDPEWVETHANSVVATLVPGLDNRRITAPRRRADTS
jgi:TetR/AcrR family transcriptional regulator